MNSFARTKSANVSQAQVVASASFSFWAHLYLLDVIERKAQAMGFFVPSSCTCKRTVLNPYDEASAHIMVLSRSDSSWAWPQRHSFLLDRISRRGIVFLDGFSINFCWLLIIPERSKFRNILRSLHLFDSCILVWIGAYSFSAETVASALKLFSSKICTRLGSK